MSGDEAAWLTVTDIAKRLGRPNSTVRYWRNTFRDVLDARSDAAGHPTYRLADFEVIDVLLSQRTPRVDIRRSLTQQAESVPPADSATVTFEAAVLARLDRLIEAVERIADRLNPKEGAP